MNRNQNSSIFKHKSSPKFRLLLKTAMRLLNSRKLQSAVQQLCCQEQKALPAGGIGVLDTCLVNSDSSLFLYLFEVLYWIPYAVFAVILLFVTIPIFSKRCSSMARCNTLSDRRAIFFTLFEDRIRREFQTQSADTMSTIVTAVSHILLPIPERPSILLCLASSDAKETRARIVRAIAGAVMSAFQKPSYNIDKVTLNSSNYASTDQFWKFYEDMSERMRLDKVVVLEDFDKINPQVATALCHLADDTYAPFPQSIIIACLDIGNRFDSSNLKRQAPVTLAETFLEEKWEYFLDRIALTELLGRLTGRAVLIEREIPLRRRPGSLPSITGYLGPPPKLRRRRQIARSEMHI